MINLLDILFGCRHRSMSRVFTRRNGPMSQWANEPMTYQVCLDCGAEFEYSLATMQRGKKIFRGAQRPDMVTLERELRSKHSPLRVVEGRETKGKEAAVVMRAAPIRKIR